MAEEKKRENTDNLTSILIEVLLSEHKARRETIMTIVESLKDKMIIRDDGDEIDEIDQNIAFEQFNDIMSSSVENDKNIVKLIELLLKYEHSGTQEQIEKIKEFQTNLSENTLNLTFEED